MLGLHPQYQEALRPFGWTTFARVASHFLGPNYRQRTRVLVKPASLATAADTLPVFYKHYEYRTHWWGALGFQSKARREFCNYDVFHSLGIPCADHIAWGEERDRWGLLRRGFVLTRAIPQAVTLLEWTAAIPSREQRAAVFAQLAAMTQRIHQAGFFHNDLVWRNILVTTATDGAGQAWWIDCPRGRFDRWSPLRRGLMLKDLAALDKSASQHCRNAERLAFLKAYLGIARLTPAAKKLIRDAIAFRRRRWPEDWQGR